MEKRVLDLMAEFSINRRKVQINFVCMTKIDGHYKIVSQSNPDNDYH